MTNKSFIMLSFIIALVAAQSSLAAVPNAVTLQTPHLRFDISPDTGAYEVTDTQGAVTWQSNPYTPRFGQVTLWIEGKPQTIPLSKCQIERNANSLVATFTPVPNNNGSIRVKIEPSSDGRSLTFSYSNSGLSLERIRLLDESLWVTAEEKGQVLVPVREGLLVPADSKLEFTHSFDTYAYEGCHMTMLGIVKNGAAALVTWDDCYPAAEVKSQIKNQKSQILSLSLSLRKSATSFTLHMLGKGDHVTIAKAYRQVAKDKGWLVTWDQKLKENPHRAALFGTINYKLWSMLDRRMNEDSTKEERVRLNWTFDEAAQVAEHLKNDLKLGKVLFAMGGWIRRGYDNQHPDILPSAPECGGDEQFAQASRRIRALGYVLNLHDNYQDMYKDAPSWDESYLMKHPDGKPQRGGHWAGGFAYLTCSQRAVELAKRPQNLPAVKKLTDADSYFIDTTYAAGLCECFDPKHPLTRKDDMKWKQAISDYSREVFGIFGSECGREWAIPHSDFFEGLTGVSGTYYHNKDLVPKLGATVVPLFELVYRDCIAMYGKYGYNINQSAEYVLHHISIGRTLNYHSIPQHLYWKQPQADAAGLPLEPSIAESKQTAPRQLSITWRWNVEKPPAEDWLAFVHFTDSAGAIKFQSDYKPNPATSKWTVGLLNQGPFTVAVPEGLSGTFDIRVGLFQPDNDVRAKMGGSDDGQRRYIVGKLRVAADGIALISSETQGADGALYVHADNGWAAGMHPLDRFVKNTYEILSPLNEITSQLQMTAHQFLSPDRKVRRTVFGEGPSAVTVTVNGSAQTFSCQSTSLGEVLLPPNGFFIESPTFVAFCATNFAGHAYPAPTLFTLRSLDKAPIPQSRQIRVFHAFGDPRLILQKRQFRVEKEQIISNP